MQAVEARRANIGKDNSSGMGTPTNGVNIDMTAHSRSFLGHESKT